MDRDFLENTRDKIGEKNKWIYWIRELTFLERLGHTDLTP